MLQGVGNRRRARSWGHTASARASGHLSSPEPQPSPAPPHPLPRCRPRSRIFSLQPAAHHQPPSPESSSGEKEEERKGCSDNPKAFHLSSPQMYKPAQSSAPLPLSLAHNQMIAQGFSEKRREVSPLPIWEGASHYMQKEMHLFPEVAWGRKSS